MDGALEQKITDIERKLDRVAESTEKTRKYFMWMLILTLVFLLIPLIGLMFVLPMFFQALSLFEGL